MLRRFLFIFLPMAALLTTAVWYLYTLEIKAKMALTEINGLDHVQFQSQVIASYFQNIISDLEMLSELHELKKLANNDSDYSPEELKDDFISILLRNRIYDQVRYITADGMENIRVNYNNRKPALMPENRLQNKANRYYFKETIKRLATEVYISPLDLNVEDGELERPFKPVIRLGTPVFNNDGQLRGALILNFAASVLIQEFKEIAQNSLGADHLLNPGGYWLSGPRPEDEFGFVFGDRQKKTFGKVFPEAWRKISSEKSGQFSTMNGLFTFTTFYPALVARHAHEGYIKEDEFSLGVAKSIYWKIVSFVPQKLLHQKSHEEAEEQFSWLLKIYVLLLLIIGASSYFQARAQTQAAKAQDELRVSAHTLAEAQEIAHIGSWEWDIVTGGLKWTDEIYRIFGFQPQEFAATYDAFISAVHPDDRASVIQAVDLAVKQNKPYDIENRIIRPDDSVRFVHERGVVNADDSGKPLRMVGTVHDVTQRRLAENTLKNYRDNLEKLVEERTKELSDTNLELKFQKFALDEHAIVSATDVKGNITYVNDWFCDISGYTREELIGKNHRMVKSSEHSPEFYRDMWRTISRGKTWHGEVKNRKKDGGYYWVKATMVPFMSERGKPFQYISIRTDITERKRIEKDLLKAKEIAEEVNIALKIAKEEAEKANTAKSVFLSSMSHELRTPLNSILGFSQLLSTDMTNPLTESQKDFITRINNSGNHLLELIDEVLDLSKIEAGKLSISPEDIELGPVMLESIMAITQLAESRGIKINCEKPDKSLYVKADLTRLRQVILNFLSNAVKYNRENGEVMLSCEIVDDKTLRINVDDTGHGISEENMGSLFEPFSRMDEESSDIEGTGIGLTITKKTC